MFIKKTFLFFKTSQIKTKQHISNGIHLFLLYQKFSKIINQELEKPARIRSPAFVKTRTALLVYKDRTEQFLKEQFFVEQGWDITVRN